MLNRDSFNELFEKKPKVLLSIIKALFERLRTANKMLISKDVLGEDAIEHKEFGQAIIVVLSGTNGTSRDALARLSQFEVFWQAKSLLINENALKVYTTNCYFTTSR